MNQLEIKHLRMICAIAESGNMTRAAAQLCITQSALSQQLKDIETKLATDLFYRTRKKMILTEAGKQLESTAIEVLASIRQAEQTIFSKMKGEKGELKIGTQCIFCYKWLPQVMNRFNVKFPNIEIEVGNSLNLQEELEDKKYNMVISGAVSPQDNHTSIPLFQDQLVCVMAEDHPLASCEFVHLADFGNYNLISHTEKNRNRFYQYSLKPKGIEPQRVMNIGAPQAILEMVIAGFGISIFPRWAIAESIHSRKIAARPITMRGLPLTWYAVYLTHSNIPIYLQEFIRNISSLNVTTQKGLSEEAVEAH